MLSTLLKTSRTIIPTISYITTVGSADSNRIVTFSNVSYGGPGLIIIGVSAETVVGYNSYVSSLTIGGVEASLIVRNKDITDTDGTASAALYFLNITSGTSADIVVTHPDTGASVLRRQIGVWRIQNLNSNTAVSTNSATSGSGGGLSVSLSSLPINSIVIAQYSAGGNASNVTFTGVTERFDTSISGFTGSWAAGGDTVFAGGSLTVSTSHTSISDGNVLACAAWR